MDGARDHRMPHRVEVHVVGEVRARALELGGEQVGGERDVSAWAVAMSSFIFSEESRCSNNRVAAACLSVSFLTSSGVVALVHASAVFFFPLSERSLGTPISRNSSKCASHLSES